MKKQKRKNSGASRLILILILFVIIIVSIVGGIIREKNNPSIQETETTTESQGANDDSQQIQDELVGVLKNDEEARKAIIALIRQYRAACVAGDTDTIAALFGLPYLDNAAVYQAMPTIITGYQNTECYIMDGMDNASKIVFIYDDIKLSQFEVLVPNVSVLCVRAREDGTVYIDPGTYNSETSSYEYDSDMTTYMNNLKGSSDIAILIRDSNEKFAKICQTNKNLKEYFEQITTGSGEQSVQ